jgi:ferredoxin, 2Fe-2S
MPKITYIEHSGKSHTVEVPVGHSVMNGAIENKIPGIDADCGGQCACGTCHVYVQAPWFDKVGTRNAQEADMLEFASAAEANSRLSCQIQVTAALDGLVVKMPEGQH